MHKQHVAQPQILSMLAGYGIGVQHCFCKLDMRSLRASDPTFQMLSLFGNRPVLTCRLLLFYCPEWHASFALLETGLGESGLLLEWKSDSQVLSRYHDSRHHESLNASQRL